MHRSRDARRELGSKSDAAVTIPGLMFLSGTGSQQLDRTVAIDEGDLYADEGASRQKSPRCPLGLGMSGNGGDWADLVARRAEELADGLVQALAQAGELAWVAGVDAAALRLDQPRRR